MNQPKSDWQRAREFLRGERDDELFAQSAAGSVVLVDSEAAQLKLAAGQCGIVKMDGQRGMTATAGMSLLKKIGSKLTDLPNYEEAKLGGVIRG